VHSARNIVPFLLTLCSVVSTISLDLAKDIAAMRDSNSKEEKLNIYLNGSNAYDDRGQ
jgi:hypothetical protein